MDNSVEPLLRAGRATVRSAAPGSSHPQPSNARSMLEIKRSNTISLDLSWTADRSGQSCFNAIHGLMPVDPVHRTVDPFRVLIILQKHP
jgi:hypothetical protein